MTANRPHRYLARLTVIERRIVSVARSHSHWVRDNAYLLAIASAASLGLSGCTGMLASRGLDLDKMQSDAVVQSRLGKPISSGTTEGKQYEDFHTHQKIAYKPGAGYAMGFCMTLGLCDLFLFPIEVVKASSEMIKGHDVRVIYESDGKVSTILVDGKYDLGAGQFGSREQAKLWQRLRQSVDECSFFA